MLIITLNIIRRKNLQQENFNLKLVDLLEQQGGKNILLVERNLHQN